MGAKEIIFLIILLTWSISGIIGVINPKHKIENIPKIIFCCMTPTLPILQIILFN